MRIEFLTPSNQRWHDAMAQVGHDVYHLPTYVALTARQEQGEAMAFFAEEGGAWLLVPIIVRPVAPDFSGATRPLFDVTSPYGYSSPLTNVHSDPAATDTDFLDRAVRAFVNALRDRGIVSAFVRLHPLLPSPLASLAKMGSVVRHGETVFIDLTRSREEFWSTTRRDHRRDINRADRAGFVARIDETWECFDAFVEIYQQTMRRVGADDSYYFSADYFAALRRILGDRCQLSIVEFEGQVINAGIVTEVETIVQTHLGGTHDGFVAASPEKARVHFLRDWAKTRGNRVLHLGGGVGSTNDSLFYFKAGFSNDRSPFYTWRVVTDDVAYHQLVMRWQCEHGTAAEEPDGFFPAYRTKPERVVECDEH